MGENKRMKQYTQHEHNIQTAFFQWAALQKRRFPGLELAFAIPNGGWRHPKTARFLKAEGVKPGVPDVFLPVPQGPFHGLFIEFKYGKNTQTPAQKELARKLQDQGYAVAVCYSLQEAIAAVEKYYGHSPRKRHRREE